MDRTDTYEFEIKELRERVGNTVYDNIFQKVVELNPFEKRSIENKFLKLMEELGELASEVIKLKGDTYKDYSKKDLTGEIADVLLMIFSITAELQAIAKISNKTLYKTCNDKLEKWKNTIDLYKNKDGCKHYMTDHS